VVFVEVWDESVTIRATRNTFSAQRRAAFVRELVEEGFVPEDCLSVFLSGAETSCRAVHWIVDPSWLIQDEAMAARTRRFVLKLTVAAAAMLALFVGSASVGYFGGGTQRPAGRPNELIDSRGQHYVRSPD
jgi:hypothetical protein